MDEIKQRLKNNTGHELLPPANQYCKHCGNPMFVKEQSRKDCPKNRSELR